MRNAWVLGAATIFLGLGQTAGVAAQAPEQEGRPAARAEGKPADAKEAAPKEESSVTEHTVRIGGQTSPHQATASTTLFENGKDEPTGLLESVAYTPSDV